MTADSAREATGTDLAAARQRQDAAVRRYRLALVAAGPVLRARARRRSAAVRLFVAALVVVTAGLVVAAGLGVRERAAAQERLDEAAAARTAAIGAVTLMLTPDPARADAYVASLLEVTTGRQRDRIGLVAGDLAGFAQSLDQPATATVLTAGVISASEDAAALVIVADTANPELVGAAGDGGRITVRVDMRRVGGAWLVELAEAVR